jgi:hypothetical protein
LDAFRCAMTPERATVSRRVSNITVFSAASNLTVMPHRPQVRFMCACLSLSSFVYVF